MNLTSCIVSKATSVVGPSTVGGLQFHSAPWALSQYASSVLTHLEDVDFSNHPTGVRNEGDDEEKDRISLDFVTFLCVDV